LRAQRALALARRGQVQQERGTLRGALRKRREEDAGGTPDFGQRSREGS
jgi:hypothetical protein